MTEEITMEGSRPSKSSPDSRLKWHPLATIITPHMPTQGFYPDSYPRGAVVHFTAGRDATEEDARNTVSWGREQGYCYLLIGPTGNIYQSAPLDRWGYHAGESSWPGLGTGVSSKLVGIEVCCAGRLDDDNKSWFGTSYPASEIRSVTEQDYGCPSGKYKRYNDAQEDALFQLLVWLKRNNPSAFSYDLVLGHHEVSGMRGIGRWRKNDPGGSLSITMDALRKRLQEMPQS